MDNPAPRVFISYSWTDKKHIEWVVGLAKRLREDGVDAVLDKWELQLGHDRYVFMERMVNDETITKVLVICDARYAEKANNRQGGVGTETQIITPEVYEATNQEKFIPIIKEHDSEGNACVPTFFKTRLHIDFTDETTFEEKYEELLRNIHNAPAFPKPPVGKPPAHLFAPLEPRIATASKFVLLKEAVLNERAIAPALFDDFLNTFIASLEEFRITLTSENRPTFDQLVIDSISRHKPYRDNFVECLLFMLQYAAGKGTTESVFNFLEQLLPYQDRPDIQRAWCEESTDNYRFIILELFLYLIAACIRLKRYEAAAFFMEAEYYSKKNLGGSQSFCCGSAEFNNTPVSLEEWRYQRLKANQGVVAETIHMRAPSGPIAFPELLQADMLLHIRYFFPKRGAAEYWHPRCAAYAMNYGVIDLFSRAPGERGLQALKILLRIQNIDELMDGLQALYDQADYSQFGSRIHLAYRAMLNTEELIRVTGRPIGRR